jgi:hypothetical protein
LISALKITQLGDVAISAPTYHSLDSSTLERSIEMRVVATQLEESVVCRLPEGEEIEIFMLCVEGDEFYAEPDIETAQSILQELNRLAGPILPNLLASPI